MDYKTKSAIISRKKDKKNDCYTALISLFDENDPHLSGQVPKDILEFDDIEKIEIKGLGLNYFLTGSDLVINDLSSLSVNKKGKIIGLTGKQK